MGRDRGTLGDLLKHAGLRVSDPPAAPAPEPAPAAAPPAGGPDLGGCAKLVARRERKGHGGKTVVVVSGLPAPLREPVMRGLKKALGCGAHVADADVVVQGDGAPRVADWLAKHGARKVVLGN
ncbi:MAG: translation initiation factor [bacterium]|nr:translation initiation factor [bacterium]